MEKYWDGGIIINLDIQQGLEIYSGPDHWNDPDILVVGNGGLTESKSRAHFSLWCMLTAPLFAGNDLQNMDQITKETLMNSGLIAIDQDPLGKQGFKIKDYGEFEIFFKPLQKGDIAICLFNRFNHQVNVELCRKRLTAIVLQEGKVINLPLKIDQKEI